MNKAMEFSKYIHIKKKRFDVYNTSVGFMNKYSFGSYIATL